MGADSGDDALVEGIYACATDATAWVPLLERLAGRLGGAAAGVSVESRRDGKATSVVQTWTGLEPEFEHRYVAHYWRQDPWREQARSLAAGRSIHTGMLGLPTYARSAFYNELCRPFELFDLVAAIADNSDERLVALSVMRRDGAEDFGSREALVLERLVPHVRRALDIAARLGSVEEPSGLATEVFHHLATAALVVDHAGRIVLANAAAERLLCARDGIVAKQGRLTVTASTGSTELARALAAATAVIGSVGNGLRVARPSGRQAFVIRVVPLSTPLGAQRRRTALVMIDDPTMETVTPPRLLARLFDLTPREAEVALLLADGRSPKEVAASLDIAWHTVRCQLRSIYAKTGTAGQGQLIRLLARLNLVDESLHADGQAQSP